MGSMRQKSPGVWELRVFVGRDAITGKPRQVSRTVRGGKRQANAALAQLEVDLAEGQLAGVKSTVGQLLDEWLATGTPDISPVTRTTYVRTAHILKPALGNVRLDRLNAHDIEVTYKQLLATGTTVHVLRQCHVTLRAALSTGMRWGWTTKNPATLVRPPRVPKSEPRPPTVEQIRALIERIEPNDPDLAGIVTIAALTGLRRGELCGLRWSDVEGDQLHVRRSIVVADGKTLVKLPKMEKVASIVISEPVAAVLKRIRQAQLDRCAESGTVPADDGYILSMDGLGIEYRKPDHLGRAITEAAKQIGAHITPHNLRDFAATTLISSGVDIRTAASQLRHDPKVLLDHYAAQDPQRAREAAALLGHALDDDPK